MHKSRLARMAAGAAITALITVGLVAPAASAAETTRVVSGHVFLGDSNRSAAAGEVTVTATTADGGHVAGTAETDAHGDYSLSVTSDSSKVAVSVTFAYHGPDGFRDGAYPLQPLGGGHATIELTSADRPGTDITLAQPATPAPHGTLVRPHTKSTGRSSTTDVVGEGLGGHVTDSAGTAIANVQVLLSAFNRSGELDFQLTTTTDVNGAYAFSGLNTVDAFALEYTSDDYAAQTYVDSGVFYEPDYITLETNQVLTDVDVTMRHGATVSGVVTGAGVPAGDFAAGYLSVEIMVLDGVSNTWVHTGWGAIVNADGSYTIGGLPPGAYRFQTTYLGGRGESAVTSPVLTTGEGTTTTLSPRVRPFLRDLTGDSAPDLLARSTAGKLILYPGNGAGGFFTARAIGSGWQGFTAVVHAGDFNGDGFADVIARDKTGAIYLYKGNGAGGWRGGGVKIGSGWNSFNLIFSPGDFNGDGKVDLLGRTASGDLYLYKGDGAGGWSGAGVKVGSGWQGFTAVAAASDLNEDGFPDVVARDASGYLWLYPGNGSGAWKARAKIGSGWKGFTAIFGVGDFNGDWAPDILGRDANGNLWLYPGSGSGGLTAGQKIGTGWKAALILN